MSWDLPSPAASPCQKLLKNQLKSHQRSISCFASSNWHEQRESTHQVWLPYRSRNSASSLTLKFCQNSFIFLANKAETLGNFPTIPPHEGQMQLWFLENTQSQNRNRCKMASQQQHALRTVTSCLVCFSEKVGSIWNTRYCTVLTVVARFGALLGLLYFFICSLDLLSDGFKLLGGEK